jgi:hypothetical protein
MQASALGIPNISTAAPFHLSGVAADDQTAQAVIVQ